MIFFILVFVKNGKSNLRQAPKFLFLTCLFRIFKKKLWKCVHTGIFCVNFAVDFVNCLWILYQSFLAQNKICLWINYLKKREAIAQLYFGANSRKSQNPSFGILNLPKPFLPYLAAIPLLLNHSLFIQLLYHSPKPFPLYPAAIPLS